MKAQKTTNVKFLIHPVNSDLIAFFPEINHLPNGYRNDLKTCYSKIGQHSSCAIEYANECRNATPEQYNDLKLELESIGYNLNIL